MAKKTVSATLVKLGDSGVGVARLGPASGQGGFVYFKPRDLTDYRGETWSELASRGLKPGRALEMDLDVDATGAVSNVSSVRFAGS